MFRVEITEQKIEELNNLLPIALFVGEQKIIVQSLQINEFQELKLEFEFDLENRLKAEEIIRIFLLSLDFKKSVA